MYQQHFAFTRFPFEPDIAADELFDTAAMREARARIEHLFELRGIGVVTGEPGCGKTACCRQVVARLPKGLYRVGYASASNGSTLDALNSLAAQFGLEQRQRRAEAFSALRDEVTRLAKEKRQLPVLIVDEAHNLRNEVLAYSLEFERE